MKRIILSCIMSAIILTINQSSFAATATVNSTAVRIRETASTDANIVTNIYKEDEVEILEENGEWYKIKYGEKVGYAKAEFFTKKGETQQESTAPQSSATNESVLATSSPEEPMANSAESQVSEEQNLVPNEEKVNNMVEDLKVGENLVLPNSLKLRMIPNFSTNPKTEIMQGSNITIQAKLGNWYKITDQTLSGWVTKSKLAAEPEIAQPSLPQQEPQTTEPVVPENVTPVENVQPEQSPVEQPKEEPQTTINKTAIVIVETARVRKTASTSSDIVEVLDEDDIVTITGEEGNFYRITSEKITSGYISKSLVKQKDVSSRSGMQERENGIEEKEDKNIEQVSSQEEKLHNTGEGIVGFAKQFLGYPYVLRM